ncbi:hypothetical protein J437_LFUL018973 [Ladona fulva]|uniref:Endonuclease/exonuclease/phosphatase domain-containing protein n=1 Tax=Ladona fulva TaxID=123851 RepID=A0A8K0KXJ0_LADFU|nr:hypothetical protein J437_LFUL018973 [Ladona fulva]
MSWNCHLIKKKVTELQDFLEEWGIDICLLQEIYLTNSQKLFINNYSIVRNDRHSIGGGVEILIKNSLAFNHLPRFKFKIVENVGISLILNNKCVNIYKTGNNIYIGDWNSKHTEWGCTTTNTNGIMLSNLITELNNNSEQLVIHTPDQHTHIHHKTSSDILDFIIFNNIKNSLNPTGLFEFQSDHFPIYFTLTNQPHQISKAPSYSTNWHKFTEYIQNHIKNIPTLQNSTPNHINHQIKLITFSLAKSHSTTTTPTHKQKTKLPEHIHNMIKLRNKHRRQILTFKHPRDKHLYHQYKNTIRKEITKF